jgi:hypothetical protein
MSANDDFEKQFNEWLSGAGDGRDQLAEVLQEIGDPHATVVVRTLMLVVESLRQLPSVLAGAHIEAFVKAATSAITDSSPPPDVEGYFKSPASAMLLASLAMIYAATMFAGDAAEQAGDAELQAALASDGNATLTMIREIAGRARKS